MFVGSDHLSQLFDKRYLGISIWALELKFIVEKQPQLHLIVAQGHRIAVKV